MMFPEFPTHALYLLSFLCTQFALAFGFGPVVDWFSLSPVDGHMVDPVFSLGWSLW